MAYRNNQWFGLSRTADTGESLLSTRSTRAGYTVSGADNDDFIYPDRAVRTMNGDRVQILKRGYIRSLAFGENKEAFPIRKCQFQFNPSQIVQSVQQNTAVLNFVQQDPSQYAQPMPGNVTFSFDLFFDRSMEINNWKRTDEIDPNNPWEKSSPSNVGVLHDLSALYKVIGVGVNEAMAEYLRQSAVASYNQQVADDEETSEEFDLSEFNSNIESLMEYNIGNTAFLLPLPVRVVFSSLYIVEGLVKDINVMFSKFTASMVPMQCSVQVMFEAKYIGFARKDTFFTYALRELETVEPTEPTAEELQAYGQALTDDLSNVRMVVTTGNGSTAGDDGDRERNWQDNEVKMEMFVSDQGPDPDRDLDDVQLYLKVLFDGEQNNRRLLSLMEENNLNVSISVSGNATAYRYTDTFRNANSRIFAQLNQNSRPEGNGTSNPLSPAAQSSGEDLFDALSAARFADVGVSAYETMPDNGGNDRQFRSVTKLWSVDIGADNVYESGITEATNGEEWRKMADWACTSDSHKGGLSGSGQDDKSVGPTPSDEGKFPDLNRFYFAIKFRLTIVVTINGATERRTVTDYIIPDFKGVNFKTIKKLLFRDWPSGDNVVSPGSGTVTSDGGGGSGGSGLGKM